MLSVLVIVGAFSCRGERETREAASPPAEPRAKEKAPEETKASVRESNAAWRIEASGRIVAIGDLHGDIRATREALKIAGVLGDGDRWIGGDTILVQTGDQLDRGDDERAILELLEKLRAQAPKSGGAVHILNGNHEYMNVLGDFRYVTRGALDDFGSTMQERAAAFAPGGQWAKALAERPVVLMVGETLFAHGGVLPHHVDRIGWFNEHSRRLLGGDPSGNRALLGALMAEDSPIWTRAYGQAVDASTCATLEQTLRAAGAKRLVIGHTVQPQGITSACDGKVWRIDVGMSSHYGGRPAALEIEGDQVRALGPEDARSPTQPTP